MTTTNQLFDLLLGRLADIEVGWSLGTFGAIAEFTRDAGEPAAIHRADRTIAVTTGRGGLRIEVRPFRRGHHAAFQALLDRYGDPDLVALKRQVVESIGGGRAPVEVSLPDDRFARATVRVALRQLQGSERPFLALAAWLPAYERADPAEEPMEAPH